MKKHPFRTIMPDLRSLFLTIATLAVICLSITTPSAAEIIWSEERVTLTLEEALDITRSNSLSIANAALEVQKAEKDRSIASRRSLPTLGFDARYTRMDEGSVSGTTIPGFETPNSRADLSLTAFMPLYTGGRLSTGRRQATLGLVLTMEEERAILGDVLLEVAATFYEVQASQELVTIAGEALAASRRHLADVAALLDKGQVARVDLVRSELDVAERERDQASAENGLVLAAEELSSILYPDHPVSVSVHGEPPPPEEHGTVEEWMDEARNKSSEIISARVSLELAQANLDAARAEKNVDVNLFGTYGATDKDFSIDEDARYWNAGANLTYPLYTGGRRTLNVKKELDAQHQAANRLIQTERNVRKLVVNALSSMELGIRQYAAAGKAVEAGEENLRVTRLKYGQGLVPNTDVIDAQLSLLRALLDRVRALQTYHTSRFRLLRAVGALEEMS